MNADSPSGKRPFIERWGAILIGLFVVFVLVGLLFPAVGVSKRSLRAEARQVVQLLSVAIKAYNTEYGTPLAGSPSEILAALRGRNLREIDFFDMRQDAFNSQGEVMDPWGTPYRFNLSDPQQPRVWSCGGNRKDENGAEGTDDIVSWR